MLAPRVGATALVVFSTAPGRSFRQAFKLAVPPEVAAQADSEFVRIKADPLSSKLWGGNSYRWWADILDHDLTADVLWCALPSSLSTASGTDQPPFKSRAWCGTIFNEPAAAT